MINLVACLILPTLEVPDAQNAQNAFGKMPILDQLMFF